MIKIIEKAIYIAIIVISFFAINGAVNLSIKDYQQTNICPKLLGIPACYVVLVCFLFILVPHIKRVYRRNLWYFGVLAIPLLLALSGTLSELSGKVVCPRTAGGIPMCYISLGICLSLLLLKLGEMLTNRFLTDGLKDR